MITDMHLLTDLQKRHKREYRRQQRARFTRPEPGFSLYEGRTRGKRMRYTYDDEDASGSDATSTRRSARQSTRNTPFESGPTTTLSGRQVRQPRTGDYGESLLSAPPLSTDELAPGYSDPEQIMSRGRSGRSTRSGTEDSEPVRGGRPTRSGGNGFGNPRKRGYNDIDGLSDEEDASGDEWDSDKNDDDEHMPDAEEDADDDLSEGVDESDLETRSLVVKLKVSPKGLLQATSARSTPALQNGSTTPPPAGDDMATAGAVKLENGADQKHTVGTNGFLEVAATKQQHATSSPNAPSSYPTPTSSSFFAAEQKPQVADTMQAAHHVPAPLPQYSNGLSAHSASNGMHLTHQAAVNGGAVVDVNRS